MFERLRFAKKMWGANKAASQITSVLSSSLNFTRNPTGILDPRMRADDFVIAYILGATWACKEAFGIKEQMERGLVVTQAFEQIFPKSGVMLTDYRNLKVKNKDAEFCHRVQLGFREMADALNSGGQKVLESLLNHIVSSYQPSDY